VTFITRRETYSLVTLNGQRIPQANDTKYLEIYLDHRPRQKKYIFTKRKQLGLQLENILAIGQKIITVKNEKKLLLYKIIFKPIWAYGIQL